MSIPSRHLLERLQKSEGFRAKPYLCPAGFTTIGYGHNLEADPAPIRPWSEDLAAAVAAGQIRGAALRDSLLDRGMIWSREEAGGQMAADLAAVLENLSLRCRAWRKLANTVAADHAGRSEGEGTGSTWGLAAETRAEVLADMAFNMGVSNLLKFRDTLAAVERGDWNAAASGMLASRWASQVGARAVELARQMRTGER
jgi:lysozyme